MTSGSEPSEEDPQYEHSCPHCRFLGTYEDARGGHDLYYCERGHFLRHATVIARHSSAPNDFSQGIDLAQFDPVLAEAVWRARGAGLL